MPKRMGAEMRELVMVEDRSQLQLERNVWSSYGETIRTSGIRSIPLFAFSVPALGAVGGPFRAAGRFEAYVVRGSSDAATFSSLFELILRDVTAGQRIFDALPSPRDKRFVTLKGTGHNDVPYHDPAKYLRHVAEFLDDE